MAPSPRKRALGLITALAVLVLGVGVARAADTISAESVCCTFAAGPDFQDLGESPTLSIPVDADSPHNITANLRGPDGKPLFHSNTIAAGATGTVFGTQYLPAGTYRFFCTLHGPSMKGELVVQGDRGTIVARPRIDVTVPSQSLEKVRHSGKISVGVKALTQSARISLQVKQGGRVLGGSSGLTLGAGASRTVTVALSAPGRRALRGLKSAIVSVKGSVPFGRPDAVQREMH